MRTSGGRQGICGAALVAAGVTALAACGVPMPGDGAAEGPAGIGGPRPLAQSIETEYGELLCAPLDETGYGWECEDPATGRPYHCKTIPCEPPEYSCRPYEPTQAPPKREPPCPDYRRLGDRGAGRDCWAPPTDACANLDFQGTYFAFCLPDGSACCENKHSCFPCGWIEMTACKDYDTGEELDPSVCEGIRAKLPPTGGSICMDLAPALGDGFCP
ncbi:MAG: hypothetical protein FJ087_13880 [Deltaproteobacteria bacterium]|nr:hypothetical protein [Deltaproteobacteria bacterium]